MKVVFCALIALAATPALAQTVFKCTGADGTVFQSSPCGADAQAERTYGGDYVISPRRQAQIDRERSHAAAVARRNAAVDRRAPSAAVPRRTQSESRHSRCDAAKAARDRAYRQRGNSRSYEFIRYWQTRVHDACS